MNVATKPVALVTGASSGMGLDFALRLIAEGYTVYGAARRVDRMGGIAAAGGIAIAMDVTDDATMVAGVDRIIADQGRIDVLINNAGYGQYGALEDVPIAEARRQMETNVIGLARLTQLCLPHMRARRFGKIFNISSIGGRFALPLGGWYHASKFALEAYSDALRNEVRGFGIDVIVIEPGAIKTEWGPIAHESLLRTSGDTAYAPYARRHAKMHEWAGRSGLGSPPEVVADTIGRAVAARRPRTRYPTGGGAKWMLRLNSLMSDRMADRLMWRMSQADRD